MIVPIQFVGAGATESAMDAAQALQKAGLTIALLDGPNIDVEVKTSNEEAAIWSIDVVLNAAGHTQLPQAA